MIKYDKKLHQLIIGGTLTLDDTPFRSHLRDELTYVKNWEDLFGCWNSHIRGIMQYQPDFYCYLFSWYAAFDARINVCGFSNSTDIHIKPLQEMIGQIATKYEQEIFETFIPVWEREHENIMCLRRYARFIKLMMPCYVMVYNRMKHYKHPVAEIDYWFNGLIGSIQPCLPAAAYINGMTNKLYNRDVVSLMEKLPFHNSKSLRDLCMKIRTTLPRAMMLVDPFRPGALNVETYFQACVTKRIWSECQAEHKAKLAEVQTTLATGEFAKKAAQEIEQLQINKCDLSIEERTRQASLVVVSFLQAIGYPTVATSFWNVAFKTNRKDEHVH